MSAARHIEGKRRPALPLDVALERRKTAPRCGLMVVDLRTGDAVHELHIEGTLSELHDVAILPNTRRPMALGLKTDQIRHTITITGTA